MTEPNENSDLEDLYGAGLLHELDPDADFDPDPPAGTEAAEDNPLAMQDNVQLTSVGIDIGSSGTQVIFSRVHLQRLSEGLANRYVVVGRETLHESPVRLTPYRDETSIDEEALSAIVNEAYERAGLARDAIDTGVVILTGEALRRQNSERIARVAAECGGDFVCVSAGHHMEARLAAFGSGAARVSYDLGKRILNIDIGGGTTKLAVLDRGNLLETAAFHIGGRLQVTQADGRITRLEPAGRDHAARAGFDWHLSDRIDPGDLDTVAESMADLLVRALRPDPPEDVLGLYLTEPISDFSGIHGVMFSGGVAEYVYGRESRDFQDMGRRLGQALRRRIDSLAWPLLPAGACIRATALGASEYTVQLSGNTSFISDPGRMLPLRNLPVVRPSVDLGDSAGPRSIGTAIRKHLAAFDLDGAETDVALALPWDGPPEYQRLRVFAEGIVLGLQSRVAGGRPVYIMMDGDVAMTVGRLLRDELAIDNDIMVLDGLRIYDFDYVDLGKLRMPSRTVPVTVKSLMFNSAAPGSAVQGPAGAPEVPPA